MSKVNKTIIEKLPVESTMNEILQGNAAKPDNEKIVEAVEQAEHDIEQDPDFGPASPTDDLDEGEAARLSDGENDLS